MELAEVALSLLKEQATAFHAIVLANSEFGQRVLTQSLDFPPPPHKQQISLGQIWEQATLFYFVL